MSWQRYRRYLRQALTLPSHITWRKARRKIQSRVKQDIEQLQARLLGTGISDAEFMRALDQRFPTAQAFLEHMKTRQEPCFFLNLERRRKFLFSIREYFPETESLTIAAADKVCKHLFDLLGSGPTRLEAASLRHGVWLSLCGLTLKMCFSNAQALKEMF